MFDNIGKKIKGLAKGLFILVAIFDVIVGLTLVFINNETAIIGMLVAVLGPPSAWISSFVLYGFGELIDKTCEIADNINPKLPKGDKKSRAKNIDEFAENKEDDDTDDEILQMICPKCGTKHNFDFHKCPNCKYQYN